MYQSILVPLDGSLFSEHALPTASTIAQATHATLHLVLVHVPQFVVVPGVVPAFHTDVDQQLREHEQLYLTHVAQRLEEQGLCVTTVLLDGPVAPVLDRYSTQHAIELVIMMTHGRGALGRLWFGGTADQLVRSLATPIMLLCPMADLQTVETDAVIHHILIVLDGSSVSEQIIEPALALGQLTHAAYTLLHVIEQIPVAERNELSTTALTDEAVAAARHAALRYLDGIAATLCERAPHTHIAVEVGRPSEVLATYAQQHAIDLIAMATHGRSGVVRWYLGSVATKLLHASTVPMLVYRPHARQQTHAEHH